MILILGGLPVIQDPPKSQKVAVVFGNETVSFHCIADGDELSFSWKRQDLQLPYSTTGNTTNTLVISGAREKDSGNYRCIVSNRFGTVSSDYASLNVAGMEFLLTCSLIITIQCQIIMMN